MSRYIEQNYIGSAVAHLPTKIFQTEHGIELVVPVTDVIEIIKNAPSVDIVRCRECMCYNSDEYSGIYRCYRGLSEVTADDFCSCGEKERAVRLIDADAFKQELKENYTFYGFTELLNDFYVALDEQPTIKPKRGKPDFADCEKCSRTYGTLGCCSTVSNEWVYSCLEGMLEKAYADGIKSVEPKRGKWIDNRDASDKSQLFPFECSECHDDNERTTNFCPNCGADMRKESE